MSMKRFRDDYEIVTSVDEKGRPTREAVYQGVYFEVSLDEDGLRQFKWSGLLLAAVIMGLHLGAGYLNNASMHQFFIVLPYAFAFLPLFFLVEGAFRLPKEKRAYRREEVELSFNRMKTASIALVILLGIVMVGELGFLLFSAGGGRAGLEVLFIVLETLAAAAGYFLLKVQQPIQITVVPDRDQG